MAEDVFSLVLKRPVLIIWSIASSLGATAGRLSSQALHGHRTGALFLASVVGSLADHSIDRSDLSLSDAPDLDLVLAGSPALDDPITVPREVEGSVAGEVDAHAMPELVTQLGVACKLLKLSPCLSLRFFCEHAEVLCRNVAERYADHSTSLQVP